MNAQQFVEQLSHISFRAVFNPYRDICRDHDHSDGPAIRRLNLQRYLETVAACGVESIWLGRDCGYRGGRRTGIALTDEIHLTMLQSQYGIFGISKATVGAPLRERTATEIWKALRKIDQKIFLWNVFPFHPFEEGDTMSNRRHTAKEFNQCSDVLSGLLNWLKPSRIVTLGADAHREALQLGFTATRIRHPSYGGHVEFAQSIRDLYITGRHA